MISQPLISEEGFFSTTKRQFQLKHAQQETLAALELGFHWEHSRNFSFCKVWGQKSASLRPNSGLKLSNEFGFFHNCTWDVMGKLRSAASLACDPTRSRLDLPAFQYFQHEQNQKQEYLGDYGSKSKMCRFYRITEEETEQTFSFGCGNQRVQKTRRSEKD